MAGIQLSGLASGLDWRSLVDQLIAAERTPITAMQTEKTTNTQKTTVLDNIKTSLASLQTSIKALSSDSADVFGDRSAQIAGTSTWTASASAGTPTGTYQINVSQLATRSQRTGVAAAGAPLSSTADVSGVGMATVPVGTSIIPGDFSVNGVKVSVALTDSLQDVLNRIGTATGGSVTATYDPAQDKVRLSGTGEIVLGASNDSSNFLSAFGLGNNGTAEILSPKALGTVSLASAIASANLKNAITGADASGNGTFAINGVSIDYNVNTDSVSTIMSRINSSTAGVTATYDKLNDRMQLTNKTTGDVGLSITEAPGGLLSALGLDGSATLARGQNAQFSINGGPTLTSASNTLDSAATGIAGLTVTATSESTQAVSITGDSSGVRAKVDDFIKQYNAVQSYIDQMTKTTVGTGGTVTTSVLSSDREVTEIAKSLRNKIFADVPGMTGSIKRLESLGIDFVSGSSQLEVKDSTKLDNALLSNGSDLQTLFSSKPDGLVARIDSYITKVTGSTGTIATQSESLTKQNSRIDEQIAAAERRLDQQQALLESSFIHMEEAQSTINTQLTALNNAFGLTSSSSSSSSKK